MLHLDLFSGIGGFALAVEEVWPDARHIFCDNDPFCKAVLRKHWPQAEIWGDIRELIANAKSQRFNTCGLVSESNTKKDNDRERGFASSKDKIRIDLLTGGFPCQPFSHAGKRRGKSDDRFLWPEMLECIRLFRPQWVIAENVYGILSIEQGMVFEQVCSDMEKEGYEVWPFIIPACAVNASHRRDRVWIVGHATGDGLYGAENREGDNQRGNHYQERQGKLCEPERTDSIRPDSPVPASQGLEREINKAGQGSRFDREAWNQDWKEVALGTCVRGVDDGLPTELDEVSDAKKRQERLKMLGNAIVPQVAIEIMKAIKAMKA